MLQLIGWLGSLYLVVKGFEFVSNKGYRDANDRVSGSATIAAILSWLGAAFFFYAFTVQVGSTGSPPAPDLSQIENQYPEKSAAWHDCVTAAKDAVQAAACKDVE